MWPTVIRQQQDGKKQAFDLVSCLLSERIILVTEQINSETASSICSQLMFLEAEDPNAPINMYIKSPGGVIDDGFAIYDVMNKIKCPINTIAMGMVASMGAFLLSCGSKGHRYAMPNATIMIHQPLGGAEGQASEIEIQAQRIVGLRNKLEKIMSENTNGKCSPQQMEKYCERDNYLTPQQAIDLGLIDEIIEALPKAHD